MKLLLTAFDPFGGEKVNPALEAMKLVPDRVGEAIVIKLEVPTVFGKAASLVRQAIREHRPDAVLCIGQAGGRSEMTPERVAINLDDAQIPDNEGNQPMDQVIRAEGPAAYFSTLPIKAMVEAMREAGLPAAVSNSAGTFVCNHLMYGVLHTLATESPQSQGGFMHVPFIPEQAARQPHPAPSLSLHDIAKGIKVSIAVIAKQGADNKYPQNHQ